MARHQYNISVFHMRIIDLTYPVGLEHAADKRELSTMRTVFLILSAIAALAFGDSALAQTKTLYVAAYGGSFEQTMRRDSSRRLRRSTREDRIRCGHIDRHAPRLQPQKATTDDVAIDRMMGPMYQAVALGFCGDSEKAPIYDSLYES